MRSAQAADRQIQISKQSTQARVSVGPCRGTWLGYAEVQLFRSCFPEPSAPRIACRAAAG